MQAWLCETLDGVDGLKWRELPTPEPQAGEVRVQGSPVAGRGAVLPGAHEHVPGVRLHEGGGTPGVGHSCSILWPRVEDGLLPVLRAVLPMVQSNT